MILIGVRATASGVDVSVEPFSTLDGPSAILDDRDDLMALQWSVEADRLTQMFRQHFPWLFRVCIFLIWNGIKPVSTGQPVETAGL
jgi:hypothetical protein